MFSQAKKHSGTKQDKLVKLLAEFIIGDNQPFYILQSTTFRNFINNLDPLFQIPSVKAIKPLIHNAYSNITIKLQDKLDAVNYVSLTTDLWTSRSRQSYIAITCFWVDETFKLNEHLITISNLEHPHTYLTISSAIEFQLRKWNLTNKVVAITTDNAKNMVKAIDYLNGINHIRCSAHTIQLVIGKGLNVNQMKIFIGRVKKLINFFISSKQSERLEKIQKEKFQISNEVILLYLYVDYSYMITTKNSYFIV